MKVLAIILIALLNMSVARADDWPVMQKCNDAKSENGCRVASGLVTTGAVSAGAASGIYSNKLYKKADLVEIHNTVDHFPEQNTDILSRETIDSHVRDIQEGAKVTVDYYYTPAENKELHINNQERRIQNIHNDIDHNLSRARYWDTATQSVYTTVWDTHTDEKGNTTRTSRQVYVGEEPVPGREQKARDHRREARRLRNKDLPNAHRLLAEIKSTDPEKLPLLPQKKEIIADYRSRNVTEFLANTSNKGRLVFDMERVTAKAMKNAKYLRRNALKGVGGAALGVIGGGVELVTGGVGRKVSDGAASGAEWTMEQFEENSAQ